MQKKMNEEVENVCVFPKNNFNEVIFIMKFVHTETSQVNIFALLKGRRSSQNFENYYIEQQITSTG